MNKVRSIIALSLVVCFFISQACPAALVTIVCGRDNTIFEYEEDVIRSGGIGPYFFVGQTGPYDSGGHTKRALIWFDVTGGGVPAGATVTGVAFTMSVTKVAPSDPFHDFWLHRVTQDWGEGSSFAKYGYGEPATEGDATWWHTFFDTDYWDSPGGDYLPDASETLTIGDKGDYTWGPTEAMIADVQSWVDEPAGNFGWIIIGDESKPLTARRIASRESTDPNKYPVLAVEYLCSKQGDLNGDCRVNFSDFAVLADEWDGDIDMAELAEFVSRWLQ